MKRSEINNIIGKAVRFLEKQNFKLPPFAFWGPKEWDKKGSEADEIRECMLGWDITDFGSGDFKKIGRFPAIEEDTPPQYLLFSEYPG